MSTPLSRRTVKLVVIQPVIHYAKYPIRWLFEYRRYNHFGSTLSSPSPGAAIAYAFFVVVRAFSRHQIYQVPRDSRFVTPDPGAPFSVGTLYSDSLKIARTVS